MSSSFTAAPSTLRELILQPGQGFYVPAYQRDFTWGEEQIERLFDDLENGITRSAAGSMPSTFLGSVILVSDKEGVTPRNADALPPNVLHVVDGQQRLTTILSMFAVLSTSISKKMRWFEEQGSLGVLDSWLLNTLGERRDDLLEAIAIKTYSGDSEFKMKPRLIRQASDKWGNNAVQATYESDIAWLLMEATRLRVKGQQHVAVSAPSSRKHLADVIRLITRHLDRLQAGETDCDILAELRFLSNTGLAEALVGSSPAAATNPGALDDQRKSAARLLVVASFLLKGVLVIDVKAPDEEYAFALFEPLNTTGQPLTALETLKPLVVNSEGGSGKYGGSPSEKAFGRIESHFPPSMSVSDRTRLTADLLTAFALADTGFKLPRPLLDQRQYLRSEFRPLVTSKRIQEAREFVCQLSDVSSFLSDIWNSPDSQLMSSGTDLDRLCLDVLRSTKHTIVSALLSRYYSEWKANSSEFRREEFMSVLRAVTAFWTLWRTSRPTTRSIDGVHRKLMMSGHAPSGLPPMARRVDGSQASLPAAAEVRKALLSILAVQGKIASEEDWIARVTTQHLYSTSQQLTRFILLCAHDDRIEDPDMPGLVKRGVPGCFRALTPVIWKSQYTVEHIAPQNPSSSDTSYDPNIHDQALTDRLGNLTLMPADLNDLVGNRPWPAKRNIYNVLSETDPEARITHIEKHLPGMGKKPLTVLRSASYLPLCDFLDRNTHPVFTSDYVLARGQRLAELAVERLWQMLG